MKCQNEIENNKLAKICAETGWKSPDALPMALRLIRSTTHKLPRIYRHEILMSETLVSSSAARPTEHS